MKQLMKQQKENGKRNTVFHLISNMAFVWDILSGTRLVPFKALPEPKAFAAYLLKRNATIKCAKIIRYV